MDSSEFYAEFAPWYGAYAQTKWTYIQSVNNFIEGKIKDVLTIIDIGAGDGSRLQKILIGLNKSVKATAVDDSDGMVDLLKKDATGIEVFKGDIASSEFHLSGKYDAVLCLCNVLGHIADKEGRLMALKNMANLLEDNGSLFLDVNNRYNIAQYGFKSVLVNLAKDIFSPNARNGNFILNVPAGNRRISTTVHIFSPGEMEGLLRATGLKVVQRKIIHYQTGRQMNTIWSGQLAYQLAKS